MAKGWIRAYDVEQQTLEARHPFILRSHRSEFRQSFTTTLREEARDDAPAVGTLSWGDELELPDGLSEEPWTKAVTAAGEGFLSSSHVVELAWVGRKFEAALKTEKREKKLLWGDLVQILEPRIEPDPETGKERCKVRARGSVGAMLVDDLAKDPLLEIYFIDVGQGDGVLVRTPDGRHLLIDGGLERRKQLTGKNAADFVDWKFFFDYGDHCIRLDSMMASHSDNDHYGGLHDLVRQTAAADRELDCGTVSIETFHHPGLSRWSEDELADPPHKDGLGPRKDNRFIRLLDDRQDAERAVVGERDGEKTEKLSRDWCAFIKAILDNPEQPATRFERVGVERDLLQGGGALPKLWESRDHCDVLVLGPVFENFEGGLALPDIGDKSINTNGHSICLRIDYHDARILLTGDLNKKSMGWLSESYGDRMGAWECDVAKACHHGSHDISYRFLEKVHAAATIISSGDAEGHAHPRPEIVGASAISGFRSIDRGKDRVLTPLIYMTEVERSVSLGALNRVDFRQLPIDGQPTDGAVVCRPVDELSKKDHMTPEQRREHSEIEDKDEADRFVSKSAREQGPVLGAMEDDVRTGKIDVYLSLSVPQGPLWAKNKEKRAWRSRVMDKNHYGLVNVRTDGKTILCATLNETEKKWVCHSFPARFGPQG